MSPAPPKPPAPPPPPADEPIELVDSDDLMEVTDVEEVSAADEVPSATTTVPDLSQPFSVPTAVNMMDLPAPEVLADGAPALDFTDLPAPSSAPTLELPPLDLSSPEAAPPSSVPSLDLSMFEDAPPSPPLDLTVSNSAPSLMDELPHEATPTVASPPRSDFLELDQGPSLELAGPETSSTTSQVSDLDALPDMQAPTIDIDSPVVSVDTPTQAQRSAPAPAKRKRLLVGAAASVALVAGVGAAAAFTPLSSWLGLSPAKPPPPQKVAVAPTTQAAPPPPPKPVELPRPPVTPLTRTSVDSLDHASLVAGIKGLAGADKESRGLALWAQLRLFTAYADPAAQAALQELAAAKPEPTTGVLGAAAQAGAAVLFGKPPQLKKALARLKGPAARSPQGQLVQWMAAAAAAKKKGPPNPKIVAGLDKLLAETPGMVDAAFLRAEQLLLRKDRSEGVRALGDLARHDSTEVRARALLALQRAEELTALADGLEGIHDPGPFNLAMPALRDTLWGLWVAKAAARGDVAAAATAAGQRFEARPDSADALIAWAQLSRYSQGDATKVASEGLAKITDPEARAHVGYAQVRWALDAHDKGAAQNLLKPLLALPEAVGGGWARMAEGAVALSEGQATVASRSFAAASKWRASLEDPKVALALLAAAKPGAEAELLGRLPLATHPQQVRSLEAQAAAQEAKGDFAAAGRSLEALLWSEPAAQDPLELLLRRIDLVDRAGEAMRAEALTEALAAAHPDDDRPLLKTVELARRGKRYSTMQKGYLALLGRHPNHRAYSVALAEAYLDEGKQADALKVLEQLAKVDPEARDADFLYTEGRAFGQQDIVKAKGFLLASIKAHPSPKAYILMAELEQSRGKTDEALEDYRGALDLDPSRLDLRLRMVRLMVPKGFIKEAIETLRDVLRQDPQNGEAAEILGDALREQGDAKEAVTAYEQALAARGENGAILLKIARLQLQELGQTGPAAKTLKRAVHADPRLAEAQYYLGLAMRDLGKPGDARVSLQSYLRLATDGEYSKDAREVLEDLGHR
jgi:predicted Zn-dependent protease